jgi:hypothetical protein
LNVIFAKLLARRIASMVGAAKCVGFLADMIGEGVLIVFEARLCAIATDATICQDILN